MVDALNRYTDANNASHTLRLLKYIFPRQFGLHNVFTSTTDSRETAQPFKDYTLRDQEIQQQESRTSSKDLHRIPKRLRGELITLVGKLQTLSARCPYTQLLRHYCTSKAEEPSNRGLQYHYISNSTSGATPLDTAASDLTHGPRKQLARPSKGVALLQATQYGIAHHSRSSPNSCNPMEDNSTSHAGVSAFCRAVLLKLIPKKLWGKGSGGQWNLRRIMHQVDRFIRLRRFESLSLHDVLQGIKVCFHSL